MTEHWSELLTVVDRIVAIAERFQAVCRAVAAGMKPSGPAIADPDGFRALDARLYGLRQMVGLQLPEQLRTALTPSSRYLPANHRFHGSGLVYTDWRDGISIYPDPSWFQAMLALRTEAELRMASAGRASAGGGMKRGRGGRRRLEDSRPKRFGIYQRIRQAHRPGAQYLATASALRNDKDFVDQVQTEDLRLNAKLVRTALAFFDQRERNGARNQETSAT